MGDIGCKQVMSLEVVVERLLQSLQAAKDIEHVAE